MLLHSVQLYQIVLDPANVNVHQYLTTTLVRALNCGPNKNSIAKLRYGLARSLFTFSCVGGRFERVSQNRAASLARTGGVWDSGIAPIPTKLRRPSP